MEATPTMLFSPTTRTDCSPKKYTESAFAHLDRSARPEYDKIRTLIVDWFERVPDSERHELVQRIRSGNDLNFHSAFLELYTHELLLVTGHSVVFHPKMPDTIKRPDFLARDTNGNESTVECTVATEDSDADRAVQARLNTLYDSINRVNCADVFLDLCTMGSPNSPVPGRSWRKQIQRWVDSLDCGALLAIGRVPHDVDLPRLELKHDGLTLTVRPIPKTPSARGKGQRPIGVQTSGGRFVTSHNKIRETIRDKASRYGVMNRPYVVVVNCLGELADEEEIYTAVFGPSGVWRSADFPAHTRVSAVFTLHHLLPWSVAVAAARIFHNPHASLPYSGPLASVPQATCNSEVAGVHPREALQIQAGWPYE